MKSLRASALFIVIVISFLLASITSGIVYYTFYYKMQVANQQVFNKLAHNLNSAVAYALSLPESESYTKTIDLYEEEIDPAIITGKVWGVFSVASVTVSDKNLKLSKSFMYGYAPDGESNAAIYLNDSDHALRISGKTLITGTCYLPQGLVKTEPVDGYLYEGPMQLVKGEVIKSTTKRILVNQTIIHRAEELLSFNFDQEQEGMKSEDSLFLNDSLIHSFSDPVLYLNYQDQRLQNLTCIEGNVVVYSKKHIYLRKELKLKDVIVVAPSIEFSDGYRGTLQAICSDSILVQSNTILEYPSALLLVKKNVANANPRIILRDKSSVSGILFAYSKETTDDNVYIDLNKGSFVMGQVYSTGSIDCQGVLYGGLMCKTTSLKTGRSFNTNYLLNTVIDVKKRSVYYTGSNLLPAKSKKRIIKYL